MLIFLIYICFALTDSQIYIYRNHRNNHYYVSSYFNVNITVQYLVCYMLINTDSCITFDHLSEGMYQEIKFSKWKEE